MKCLNGSAVNQCIQKKVIARRDRQQACRWCHRLDVTRARTCRRRCPKVPLPDHRSCRGVKRINIIRCGNSNNHRSVRAALDVKRLRVNIAHDRPVEIRVADQIGGVARRERWIDIVAVPRSIIIFLRDVDLPTCSRHNTGQRGHENRYNENESIIDPRSYSPAVLLQQRTHCLSRIYAAQWRRKSNAIVSFQRAQRVANLHASARYTASFTFTLMPNHCSCWVAQLR